MASLRRRLAIPTVLAVTFAGAAFVGCQGSGDDGDDSSGDDGPTTIATDGGVIADGPESDATTLDAEPMPDSPPDAPPDAPVG